MLVRIAVAAVVLALIGLIHATAFVWWPAGSWTVQTVVLARPFPSDGGLAWQAQVPAAVPSDADEPGVSRLRVLENQVALGPAHTLHATIRERGGGAFSHGRDALRFSTSDGSDPNTNGRTYMAELARPVPPWPHLLLLLLDFTFALGLALWVLTRPGRWRRLRLAARPLVVFAAIAIVVDLLAGVLFRHRLGDASEALVALARAALDGDSDRSFHGESVQYAEHHYLNYVLNPDFASGVARQFERTYRIRRTEPLRPRPQVRFRVLALGGSTTYGEQLANEQDTWVATLERQLRAELGPDVDVVNGGVGGYTLLENTIHYVTLLSALEPDLVLLYVGINDVHPRLFGDLARDYSNYRVPWRSAGSVLPVAVSWLRWSGGYRLWYLHRYVEPLRRNGIGGLTARPYPDAAAWAAALARNGAGVYRDHLRTLVRLVRSQGRQVAVMPQHFVVSKPSDATFRLGVDEHNRVNADVARELGVPFAASLLEAGAFTADDTLDHCHFNERGSRRMAELVAAFLRANTLLPR
ncbi:MAG TPA: SGNH/GDSL hydrolase family protein [Planctomycetota bacterium]|nr:SGNH/GDSL hydrolase family protein [Planctomycetota bacterium]